MEAKWIKRVALKLHPQNKIFATHRKREMIKKPVKMIDPLNQFDVEIN